MPNEIVSLDDAIKATFAKIEAEKARDRDAARYRLARSHQFRLIDLRDEEAIDAALIERGA